VRKVLRTPHDEAYGDRAAAIADPRGRGWGIESHIKDVDPQRDVPSRGGARARQNLITTAQGLTVSWQ
jgi:hypothetical protein